MVSKASATYGSAQAIDYILNDEGKAVEKKSKRTCQWIAYSLIGLIFIFVLVSFAFSFFSDNSLIPVWASILILVFNCFSLIKTQKTH